MPLPKPKKDEKRKEFVSRCIANLTEKGEFDSSEQRAAVCHDQWEESKKKSKSTEAEKPEETPAETEPTEEQTTEKEGKKITDTLEELSERLIKFIWPKK